MPRPLDRRLVPTALAALLAALALGGPIASPAHATDPCSAANGSPGTPPGEPGPTIAGTVSDGSTSTAIAGATIELYACVGATSVFAASTTTDGSGRYAFDALDGPAWYYVAAALTGPLAGMAPSGGTHNPSELVGVGDGDPALDLAFD